MTNKTLTLIKHKLQWLALLVALLGVSQGVWARTQIYVAAGTTDGYDNPYIYVWNGSGNNGWPGVAMEYAGTVTYSNNCYPVYTYTWTSDISQFIVMDGNCGDVCKRTGDITINATEGYIYCISDAEWRSSLDTWTLRGFNDWNNPISMSGSGSTFTCEKTLSANTTYDSNTGNGFKIVSTNFENTTTWYGNNGTMTSNNCSDWTFSTGDNNCGITTVNAGTYTFSFDVSTKKLTVTYPEACTAPTVVTNSTVSSITASGATVKGTITDGTCSVTASGIAYGTSTNPTSGTSVVYTSGTEFSANLTGLSAGTKYYFRTYATANGTTTYGEEHSFTTLYEEPSAIYIKGPIHDADCWPGYNDTPLTKNGTTYSQTFSAYNNTSCSYGPKEFVLSTSTSDANKLNGNKTFNGAETNGWAYSTRDGANTNFNCTLDYSAGEKITLTVIFDTSTGEYTMTMAKACTTPTEGFAITAQLNVGKGSPWEGTQGTSGGDHASGGVFADGYRTATLTTSISATNYEWYGCESDGSNETTTPANVTFTDRTSQTCTAQFNLPGTYYFKCKAGCADASVASGVVQINVPYPSMGISGPFLSGNDTWDHAGAGTGGLMERDGLTWTKTFECNTASGEFVIIQQYKLGCDKYNGWDGYKECNDDGKGNKINSSTLNCTNINWSKGNNMTAAIDGLSNNEKVTITVTMTGYDTYTVTMAEYSPQLSGTDITGLNFNDCEGSHQFNFSDMFKFNVDSWSAAVTDSEVDATSDFELTQEGYMVWNTSDKEAGDYSYTFTAYKSGSSATALLTFTYSAKAKLNDITIVSGETPTYPYIKIELECSVGGSVNDIKWSVDNNGLVVRTGIGTAYFKGKAVNKSTTYTISAVGLSDTCGETEPKTIEIVVNPEPEEVCTPN